MPQTVLLDEWHLTFRILASLSDAEVRAIRRVLNGKAFTADVRRSVLVVVRERPALKSVRVVVNR